MQALDYNAMGDVDLIDLARRRDPVAIREITTRNNQRLFRAAWSILRDHADAEEVVQEGYLKAFSSLHSYTGTSSFSTWITRIVVNAALDRKRAATRRRTALISQDVAMLDEYRARFARSDNSTPENELLRSELTRLLKGAIAELSEEYRTVFVLRDIEGMSVAEAASALSISESAVKTRLLRARRRLRETLTPNINSILDATIAFAGADCERLTTKVLAAMSLLRNHERNYKDE